jgi:hypothetical protein
LDIPPKAQALTWAEFVNNLCRCRVGDYFEEIGVIINHRMSDSVRRFAKLIRERDENIR